MKNFEKTKNSRMFAVPKPIRLISVVVFFLLQTSVLANNISYQIPVDYRTEKSVIGFGESGGDSFSYLHTSTNNFHSQMPKPMKITNSVKNSNGIGTPYGAKSVLSATQSNDQGCNISGNIKNIKIINGITAEQLRFTLKSILSEFIENGVIDLKHSKL